MDSLIKSALPMRKARCKLAVSPVMRVSMSPVVERLKKSSESVLSLVVGQELNLVFASFQNLGTPRTRSRGFGCSVLVSSQVRNR